MIEIRGTAKMNTEIRPTERDFLKSSQIIVEFLNYDRIRTERELYDVVKHVYVTIHNLEVTDKRKINQTGFSTAVYSQKRL